MEKQRIYTCLGMMSGTSLDGIDISMIKTDGETVHEVLSQYDLFVPYEEDVKDAIRATFGETDINRTDIRYASAMVTKAYQDALDLFFERRDLSLKEIDLIGAHGQTITHIPDQALTIQIGNAQALADHMGISVVFDLRQNDILNGGQGAPLLPIYHHALAQKMQQNQPVAFLNLGGVGNITFVKNDNPEHMMAFDTGPANAYMDDLSKRRHIGTMDQDGALAKQGNFSKDIVTAFMLDPYFQKSAPKSLDRDHFSWLLEAVEDLSNEDAMATLLECSVQSVVQAVEKILPEMPSQIYVSGGGARNAYFMQRLQDCLSEKIEFLPFQMDGINPDFIEAQGFAYLAARSVLGLPLTFPTTTGVHENLSGGMLYEPKPISQTQDKEQRVINAQNN